MTALESPPGFRRHLLRAQHIGRGLLVVFVLAGVLGLFGGSGVFAQQVIALPDDTSILAPRFVRIQTPFTLVARRGGGSDRPLRITLSDELVRSLSIEQVTPTPQRSNWSANGLELVFAEGTDRISLRARPEAVGRIGGHIRMDSGPRVAVPLWTYP